MDGAKKLISTTCFLLISFFGVVGCATASKEHALKETAVDTELSEQPLPSSAPQVAPEKPREGFNQDSKDTRIL